MSDLASVSWLHQQSSWLVALALAGGMLIVSRLGYVAGLCLQARSSDGGRGHFSGVQSSLLGLLALLLGFTLNMADQRFEARRQLMLDDAVDLGALDLSAGFLAESRVAEFRQLLREYVAQHANANHLNYQRDSDEFRAEVAHAEDLHRRMTAIVRAEEQGKDAAPAPVVDLLVEQLGDALAVHRRWITAMETRVPPAIFALLGCAALAAAGIVGFSGGLAKHRAIAQSVLLAVFVSGIFFVIHDLDTPDSGLAQSEREPLIHLSELLTHGPQKHP
jgi:hypothetical protein